MVGKPVFNIMLNYYIGDYKPISGAIPMDTLVNTTLGSEYRPLFDGNISSMAVNINALNHPLLYNYQYIQIEYIAMIIQYDRISQVLK